VRGDIGRVFFGDFHRAAAGPGSTVRSETVPSASSPKRSIAVASVRDMTAPSKKVVAHRGAG